MKVTKVYFDKNKTNYALTDAMVGGEILHLSKSARELFRIPKAAEVEDGYTIKIEVEITITKFDNDLPCRVHEVEINYDKKTYHGYIIQDLGMRTHSAPTLRVG